MRLRGPLNDYQLRASIEVELDEQGAAERITDHGDALRVLRRLFVDDPSAASGLRRLAREVLPGWTQDEDGELVAQLAAAVERGSLLLTRAWRSIASSDELTRVETYEPPPLEPYEELEVFLRVYSEHEDWTLAVEGEAEDWPTLEVRGDIEELGFSIEGEPDVNDPPAAATR